MAESDLESRVARLEASLDILRRLETKMDEVTEIARQIAAMEQKHQSQSNALERVFGNLDKVRSRLDAEEEARMAAERRLDSWVNRGKGAWWAASFLWGGIQAVVGGAVVWLFDRITQLHDTVLLLEQAVKNGQ